MSNCVRVARLSAHGRQISEVLRLICEANLEAFSRHSLKERARAVRDSQAAEIRRMLDLKMSDMEAVDRGASKDETLKRLNVREATLWAGTLRWDAEGGLEARRNCFPFCMPYPSKIVKYSIF